MTVGILGDDKKSYVYDESFWSGKKQLIIDGAEAVLTGKCTFVTADAEEVEVRGNIFFGYKLCFSNGRVQSLFKNKWYEWLFMCLPFVISLFAFMYLPVLVMVLGILGGLMGVVLPLLIGGLGAFFNFFAVRTDLSLPRKCFLVIFGVCLTFLVWFLIYGLMFGGFDSVFDNLIRHYTR
jgi:hypothetical protein